jgi:putative adhesin
MQPRIPSLLLFIALACGPKTSGAESGHGSSEPAAGPKSSARDFEWSGEVARIDISTVLGDVEIRAGSGKTTVVRGTKSGKDAADVTIEAVVRGDTVVIAPKYPRRGNNDARIDFVVELPASVEVEAHAVNGKLVAEGVSAPVSLSTVDGDIATKACGDVRGNTVNGVVRVALPTRGAKRVDLEAVNGELELRMAADAGAQVRANTVSGQIRSDFPLSQKQEIVGSHASGTIGDGSVRVELSTVNGPIHIAKA